MDFNSSFIKTMTELANESTLEGWDEEDAVYEQVFDVVDVDSILGLNYGMGTEIIGDEEPQEIAFAGDHIYGQTQEGFTYFWATKLYSMGFQITQSDLDNWKHSPKKAEDFVKTRAKSIGAGARRARDRFAANIFNRGTIAAGDINFFYGTKPGLQIDANPGKIYDGQAFFDDAHPLYLASGTTFDNYTSSLAFSGPNLMTVLKTMKITNARNERNQEITIKPDVILYRGELGFDIAQVINSTLLPGSGNNDINPLKGFLKPVEWNKLTDATAWFVGEAKKGLKFYTRGEPVPVQDMEKNKGKGIYKWNLVDEYTACVTQWRHWYAADQAES